jgi:hypothetical protein
MLRRGLPSEDAPQPGDWDVDRRDYGWPADPAKCGIRDAKTTSGGSRATPERLPLAEPDHRELRMTTRC